MLTAQEQELMGQAATIRNLQALLERLGKDLDVERYVSESFARRLCKQEFCEVYPEDVRRMLETTRGEMRRIVR